MKGWKSTDSERKELPVKNYVTSVSGSGSLSQYIAVRGGCRHVVIVKLVIGECLINVILG